ncbi:E3 ubiquitin-protein ligase TRIM56-like [Acanthaster planci]|uniref:E3 ubiquitin-protein ligase TRIM56-like n=1 Tax=Acanthaster planci TaxID=133434 RepID=A0A8B7XKV0_ACAPL|nr:E3 ubiquitin-protein ligase TRIM56-like [Acanthaster planci]
MAQSEESASVVLSKISRTHLECGICHERYQVPKFLECLHSFCEHCLTTYKNTVAEVSAMMPCPVCRKKTKLPLDGVAGLKTNFHLMGMVEDFTLQEKLTRQKGLKVPCDLCQHRQEADSRCMDCPFFLCVNCRLVHLRIEATTNHEVLALDTLRSGIMSLRPKVKDDPPCQKHRGEKKRFFCETCQVLICRDCTVVEHREAEHKFTTIDDAASRFREATQKLIDNVEESWRAHKETKDALNQMASDLHRSASLSYQQVIDRGTKEESKIADYEANILKDINQRENLRKVTFRTNGIRFFQPSKSKSAESLRTGKEIKQEYSKSLKEKFVKIDKALDELSLNIETLLKTDGDIHSLIEISKEEALKKGSDDRSKVAAARDKLLLQVRSTINLRQQTITELSKMTEGQILRLRHALDTAGDVVKSAYNVDFLNLYSVIDSDLEDLLGESPPNLHPGYPRIEFKSSDGTGLGEVVVGATWRWKVFYRDPIEY